MNGVGRCAEAASGLQGSVGRVGVGAGAAAAAAAAGAGGPAAASAGAGAGGTASSFGGPSALGGPWGTRLWAGQRRRLRLRLRLRRSPIAELSDAIKQA